MPDPVKAHEIYTTKSGIVSKAFDAKGKLAVVAAILMAEKASA
ncbi:MAG: hypothetical protein ACRBC3_14010 [Burkholderiaceae bacterium]